MKICNELFHDSKHQDVSSYFKDWPYKLSDFQKWAIYALYNNYDALVCAPLVLVKHFLVNLPSNILQTKVKKLFTPLLLKHYLMTKWMNYQKNSQISHLGF